MNWRKLESIHFFCFYVMFVCDSCSHRLFQGLVVVTGELDGLLWHHQLDKYIYIYKIPEQVDITN